MTRTRFGLAVSLMLLGLLPSAQVVHAQEPAHPLPTKVDTYTDKLIPPDQRKPAPQLNLPDSDGHTFQMSALRGKVVLVDFWATWCGGCKFELPYFVAFDHQYRSAGLTSIGVSMDDGGMAVVKPFLQAKGITYPSVMGSDAVASAFHLGAMPMTVLIDRQGRVALSHAGVVDRANFEDHIRTLLAEGQ